MTSCRSIGGARLAGTISVLPTVRTLVALLTPAERRILAFLAGWAALGALASALPWTASFSRTGREPFPIPPDDPRAALHAKSLALARHLEVARTPPSEPLDPNSATREELDRLPGVGPRTALRWIAVRNSGGPFLAPLDLSRVEGLGPKRLAALESHVRFPSPRPAHGRKAEDARVNVNRASASELEALPLVGPTLAARIVTWRRTHGRYRSFADLDSVAGIGPGRLRDLGPRVRFE